MRVGADHDGVGITRQHARRVGNAFAAAELQVVLVQGNGLAAKLAHGDVERDARARRRFLENQHEDVVGDTVGLELRRHALAGRLHRMGGVDDTAQRPGVDLVEIQEMSNSVRLGHGASAGSG